MDWYRSLPDYRRKILLLLIVAILLTLPCYCIGLTLLLWGPEEAPPPSTDPAGAQLMNQVAEFRPAAPGEGPDVEPAGTWTWAGERATQVGSLQARRGVAERSSAAP
jgi:hypothetical protein